MTPTGEDDPKLARIEGAAMAIAAILPIVPYLAAFLRDGVPRFALAGDFALLEQATRHVGSGETLLGPYSRFHWHHPGPLFFYLVAPFEALFRPASTGLFVGTAVINAAASATLVFLTRICATRTHAMAVLAVFLAWFSAFGNVSANPWNPLVVTLPLMAFLGAAAFIARGESRAVCPAAFFGALALSTHVATVSTTALVGVASAVSFAIVTRRAARPVSPVERRRLAAGVGIGVLALLPPIVEQIRAPHGNLRLLAAFFASSASAPLKTFGAALRNGAIVTAWLPERLVSGAMADEGWIPLGMRWDALPDSMTPTTRAVAIAHVVLVIAAAVLARRRRDTTSLAFLAVGALAEGSALGAMRAIVGTDFYYLVFWATAASSVAWIGVLSAFFGALVAWLESAPFARAYLTRRHPLALALALVVIGCGGAATARQRAWLAKTPTLAMPGHYPDMRPSLASLHEALRERLAHGDAAVAVIHSEGAYDIAQAMVLELEKDGIDVRVPDHDRWTYVGVRSRIVERPLHVWFAKPDLPVPPVLIRKRCLELVREHGSLSMYAPTPGTCTDR